MVVELEDVDDELEELDVEVEVLVLDEEVVVVPVTTLIERISIFPLVSGPVYPMVFEPAAASSLCPIHIP